MCHECAAVSRRQFLMAAVAGGAAWGLGLARSRRRGCGRRHPQVQHLAPAGRQGGQDRLAPHAGGDEARERGRPRLHALRRRGARQGAGALRHRRPRALGHGLFHRHLDPRPLPADRRPLARGVGRRQGRGRGDRQRRLPPGPPGGVREGQAARTERLHPVVHLDPPARLQNGRSLRDEAALARAGTRPTTSRRSGPSRSSCPSATSTWPWKPGRWTAS